MNIIETIVKATKQWIDTGRSTSEDHLKTTFRTVSPTTTPRSSPPVKSYLKVKIKSLAEEATIIRHEERRVKRSIQWWCNQDAINEIASVAQDLGGTVTTNGVTFTPEECNASIEAYQNEYFGLHNHRTYEVRSESRAAQLAYAYIHGYPYTRVEDPTKTRKPVPTFRVADLAMKYGKVNIPLDTAYNKRREAAEKVISAWTEGKSHYPVDGTNGQVLKPVQ